MAKITNCVKTYEELCAGQAAILAHSHTFDRMGLSNGTTRIGRTAVRIEDRERAGLPVIEDREVLRLKALNGLSLCVPHGDVHLHHAHIRRDFDRAAILRGKCCH
jgi:hypothetical protein